MDRCSSLVVVVVRWPQGPCWTRAGVKRVKSCAGTAAGAVGVGRDGAEGLEAGTTVSKCGDATKTCGKAEAREESGRT